MQKLLEKNCNVTFLKEEKYTPRCFIGNYHVTKSLNKIIYQICKV